MSCAWPKSHCSKVNFSHCVLEEEQVPNPSGSVCGVCDCSSSGQALQFPAPGKLGKSCTGEEELLIPTVTTAKDFTASLEILGTVFLESFLFLMTFLVLAVTERHLEGKNTFLSI